jgi:hypothetical protein
LLKVFGRQAMSYTPGGTASPQGKENARPEDRLWSWSMVRSSLMGRMLVSTLGLAASRERVESARKLKASIDAALLPVIGGNGGQGRNLTTADFR